MKIEKWLKWEPVAEIPQTLFLDTFKYDCNNLVITLYNPKKESQILTIDFDGFLAFRSMDESRYLWPAREVEQAIIDMQLELDSLQKWSLFIIDNSLYIDWFLEQTGGVHDNDPIIHYLIITPCDVIEILYMKGTDSPIVKWN